VDSNRPKDATAQSSPDAEWEDLARRWSPRAFLVDGTEDVQTPALVIDQAAVDANIASIQRLIGHRWRPHVKTAKLGWTMRRLVDAGISKCKCATPLELATALDAGFEDVLLAFAVRGPAVERVIGLAQANEQRISVLVEHPDDIAGWTGSPVGIFIDLDPGCHRTGVPCDDAAAVRQIATAVSAAGLELRGLHSYEGFPAGETETARRRWCTDGYRAVCRRADELSRAGHRVGEIVTSGSVTWPLALEHPGFDAAAEEHTVSPGTVVYSDVRTAFTRSWADALKPAAAVITRVVSVGEARVTVDAGHKAVAADRGVPTGVVLGHPDVRLQTPSEEHGPATVGGGSAIGYGDLLAVVPSHVCPTVNLHDHAIIVADERIIGLERVTARGHDRPL
jgi:D-serine deaminase-like pyridoxal phosphate-dependent protein